ncbi:minor capsid protein [Enterococcus faecium]
MRFNKIQNKVIALARKLFGENDIRIKQLEKIFDESTDQLINDLNRFIANDVSWRGVADKKAIVEMEGQIAQVMAQAVTDGMKFFTTQVMNRVPNQLKTNADVFQAKVFTTVIKLSFNELRSLEESKQIMAQGVFTKYPMEVSKHDKNKKAYGLYKKQYAFSREKTPKAIDEIVSQNWAGLGDEAAIYKEKLAAVRKLDETLESIFKEKKAPRDYEKDFSKIIGSSRKRASAILRTEATAMFAKSAIEVMHLRGIDRYMIIIADRDTCAECREMDQQPFTYDQAIVGLNLPPFHTHCQCKVIPAPLNYV